MVSEFSKASNNSSPLMKNKTPPLGALFSLVLAFSLFAACKDNNVDSLTPPISCTVGDDSPCALWQRCVLQEGGQGHCVGERLCETNDDCTEAGKTCKGGVCVPSAHCEVACPSGQVCVSPDGCKPGCFEDSDCSGNRMCGGRDTTTGLGTCRNPTQA